nr:hypothetical protein [Micromonospora pattaloongensis]
MTRLSGNVGSARYAADRAELRFGPQMFDRPLDRVPVERDVGVHEEQHVTLGMPDTARPANYLVAARF